jgi:hypothetical protein
MRSEEARKRRCRIRGLTVSSRIAAAP